MVLETVVHLSEILAAAIGVIGTLFVGSFNRWRKRKIKKREEKVDWFEDLAILSQEIEIKIILRQKQFKVFEEESNLATNTILENLDIDEVEERLQEHGINANPEMIKDATTGMFSEKADTLREQFQTEMNVFEERLAQHLAQRSTEIDEEIFQSALSLCALVSTAGAVGELNDEIANQSIEEIGTLAKQCDARIEEIETSTRFWRL